MGMREMEWESRGDDSLTNPSCNGPFTPPPENKRSKQQKHTDTIQLPTRHFSRAKHRHIPFPPKNITQEKPIPLSLFVLKTQNK